MMVTRAAGSSVSTPLSQAQLFLQVAVNEPPLRKMPLSAFTALGLPTSLLPVV